MEGPLMLLFDTRGEKFAQRPLFLYSLPSVQGMFLFVCTLWLLCNSVDHNALACIFPFNLPFLPFRVVGVGI